MVASVTDVSNKLRAAWNNASSHIVCFDVDSLELLEPSKDRLQQLVTMKHIQLAFLGARPARVLERHVSLENAYYLGNHGLEISGRNVRFIEPTAAASRKVISQFGQLLKERLADIVGAVVEDDGLSIRVFHESAEAAEHEEIRRRVHAQLANSDHPFIHSSSQLTHDIRPRTDWSRGQALLWLKQQQTDFSSQVAYISGAKDDETFATLADEVTIRIGADGETAARFSLPDVATLIELLGQFIPRGPLRRKRT